MRDKVCLITGSTSGIGKATARALAEMGATVVLVARNPDRGYATRDEIASSTGNQSCRVLVADLISMSEVKGLVSEFKEEFGSLDVLVHNAGALFEERKVTDEGFERTVALNYLAPFLMTELSLDILKASSPSRVIVVASDSQSEFDFDDFQLEQGYEAMRAYDRSKMMAVMFTYDLARRLQGSGVTVNCMTPGFVKTNFGTGLKSLRLRAMLKLANLIAVSPEEGAETVVYLASSPEVGTVSGKYFKKMQETASSDWSYNEEVQCRLREETLFLLEDYL